MKTVTGSGIGETSNNTVDRNDSKEGNTGNDKKTENSDNENGSECEEVNDCESSGHDSEETEIADYSDWEVTGKMSSGENHVYWNVTGEGVADIENKDTFLHNYEKDHVLAEQTMEVDNLLNDFDNG